MTMCFKAEAENIINDRRKIPKRKKYLFFSHLWFIAFRMSVVSLTKM